jgi:hypothetical protein
VRKGNRRDHLSLDNGFGALEVRLSPAVNYIEAASTSNGRCSSLRCCHLVIARDTYLNPLKAEFLLNDI